MDETHDIRNSRVPRWLWLAYLVLFVLAVPWFWSFLPIPKTQLLWGMPLWFVVAVAVSFVVSCLTAWQLSFAWPDEELSTEDAQAAERQADSQESAP